jgi:phospholipase C
MFARLCEPPRSNRRVDLTATSGARVQSRSTEQNMTTDLNLIEHIFVVMMENRSFDHMLGYLDLPPSNVDIQGIDHAVKHGYANLYQGKSYVPELRSDPAVPVDPNHEREHVRRQMQWDANDPMMSGFIRDYATVSRTTPSELGNTTTQLTCQLWTSSQSIFACAISGSPVYRLALSQID